MALFPEFSKALREAFDQMLSSDDSSNSGGSLAEQMTQLSKNSPVQPSDLEARANNCYTVLLNLIKNRASAGKNVLILRDGHETQVDFLRGDIGKLVQEKLKKDGFKWSDYIEKDGLGYCIYWGEFDWKNRW